MKKVSELIGHELDAWVARAERQAVKVFGSDSGGDVIATRAGNRWKIIHGGTVMEQLRAGLYHPSTNPAQGQPIMERERIGARWDDETLFGQPQNRWLAEHPGLSYALEGPTALIAGMRALVASRFGEEVQTP